MLKPAAKQENLPEYFFHDASVPVLQSWWQHWPIMASIFFHLGALWLFNTLFYELPVPERWKSQVFILLVLSFFSSFYAYVRAERKSALAAKAVQAIIHLVLAIPNSRLIILNAVLLLVFACDLSVTVSRKRLLLVQIGYTALMLLPQLPIPLWQGQSLTALPHTRTLFIIWGAIIIIVNLAIAQWTQTRREMENYIQRLVRAVAQLSNANHEFQEYAEKASQQSMELERLRISREIHDTVGYTLVNLIMVMEAAKVTGLDPKTLLSLLEQAREQAQNGLSEMRNAMRNLRNLNLPELIGRNRFAKLARVFEKATGVSVLVHYGNTPDTFGDKIDEIVYRMLQEGLTNAIRHGHASAIEVHFWIHGNNELSISIVDNGSGASTVVPGVGMEGMKERLKTVGGVLTAFNNPVGFNLKALIPLLENQGSSAI